MICQAYVTGERYNIHGINSYLGNMAKYQATFIPEGTLQNKILLINQDQRPYCKL